MSVTVTDDAALVEAIRILRSRRPALDPVLAFGQTSQLQRFRWVLAELRAGRTPEGAERTVTAARDVVGGRL